MTQKLLNIKMDAQLKEDFMQACQQNGYSASLVIREFIKSFCKKNSQTTNSAQTPWDDWFEHGLTVSDDFMLERKQPPQQEREDIFQ